MPQETWQELEKEQRKDNTRCVRHFIVNPARTTKPFQEYSDIQERSILILYFVGKLSHREIASVLGITHRAVGRIINKSSESNPILKKFKKSPDIIKQRRFYDKDYQDEDSEYNETSGAD